MTDTPGDINLTPGIGLPIPAPPPDNPPAPAAPAPDATPRTTTGDGPLTAEQNRQLYDTLVAQGTMSQQEADGHHLSDLVNSGALNQEEAIAHAKAGTLPGNEDSLTRPEIKAHLAQHGAPVAAKPTDYVLPPMGENFSPELDGLIRDSLMVGGLSGPVGSNIAEELFNTNQTTANMNETDREVWARGQRDLARRILGAKAGELIDGARQLVKEIDARVPGFAELLDLSGAGDSAVVITKLALHAALLDKRVRE